MSISDPVYQAKSVEMAFVTMKALGLWCFGFEILKLVN